ncbi:hypothetical protein [Candidatus Uabimicrobium sp. HlEnr_7]|uniref:hypothetical protein n=1 Tax=Candidatus Uabimicrobium helgolandensis TaxID=3095367 RepID=UPI0035570D42
MREVVKGKNINELRDNTIYKACAIYGFDDQFIEEYQFTKCILSGSEFHNCSFRGLVSIEEIHDCYFDSCSFFNIGITGIGNDVKFKKCNFTTLYYTMCDFAFFENCKVDSLVSDWMEREEDLKYLQKLGIKIFSICNNSISEKGAKLLSAITSLEELYLDRTWKKENVSYLTTLFNLRVLSMHSGINDESLEQIKKLTKLSYLDLKYTHFTDKGLEHLQALTSLEVLNLTSVIGITEEGIRKLQKELPDCEVKRDKW